MNFKELIRLLTQKGFRDIFSILSKQKDYQADKHIFYTKLNAFSYYNSFFRVKNELINKGLIEIIHNNNQLKSIKLTKKKYCI
ncbi:hypothetical protein LCGC14_2408450 [marine sediment metagenome]|uniref:Uncharacterized protein n=1 Tax=marine sediment metagenome TaxID=412755 RepID=A0A0F9EMM7_9ZZZZ